MIYLEFIIKIIGAQKIEFEKVDINKVLEQTKLNLKYAIDVNNAKVIYNKLPTVFGDEMLIELLFQNIISNSIKYKGT